MYPCCRWYAALKQRRTNAWLSYLSAKQKILGERTAVIGDFAVEEVPSYEVVLRTAG